MVLLELLTAAQLEARKQKNTERLSIIQMALSATKNEQIAKGRTLTDDDVIVVLQRQVKQLQDACKDFETGKRDDLVQKSQYEIDVLKSFLPELMSEDEIVSIVHDAINETGAQSQKDFGKVMALVMKKVVGRADGKQVQDVVKRLLP